MCKNQLGIRIMLLCVYCTVLACLALTCAYAEEVPLPLIKNGSFDEGLKYWKTTNAEFTQVDTTTIKACAKSLKISNSGSAQWVTVWQDVKIEGGAQYNVSTWMKLENVYQSHFKVDWIDSKAKKGVGSSFICFGTNGTSDWTKLNKVTTAPDNADTAKVMMLGGKSLDGKSPGITWFNDISLTPAKSADGGFGGLVSFDGSGPGGATAAEKIRLWEASLQRKYGSAMVAPAIKEKIVYFDSRYDYNHMVAPESIVDFLTRRGFSTKNADQLSEWMNEKIQYGADGTVCVMAMDIAPDTILTPLDSSCILRQYMDKGGRVVWIGDVPLFNVSYRDRLYRRAGAYVKVLGVFFNIRGQGDSASVAVTDIGHRWGLSMDKDSLSRFALLKDITVPLSASTKDENRVGAFFKNFNADYPYSGFVKFPGWAYNGNDTRANENLYRMALYRGEKIVLPVVQESKSQATVTDMAVKTDLRNYIRGGKINVKALLQPELLKKAAKISFSMADASGNIVSTSGISPNSPTLSVGTANLASGDYKLSLKAVDAQGAVLAAANTLIYIANQKSAKVIMCSFGVPPVIRNPNKVDIVLDDLRTHLGEGAAMSTDINNTGPEFTNLCDQALRYGVRLIGRSHNYYSTSMPEDKEPELHMVLTSGKKQIMHYGVEGLCLGNPVVQSRAADYLSTEFNNVSRFPSFQLEKIILDHDDVVMHGTSFWGDDRELTCYCDYCKKTFKEQTGLEAPAAPLPDVLNKKGIISDKDPWYLWMKFRSKNYGKLNQAIGAEANKLDPMLRIGPATGCGQPVFNPYWGLNPPDSYSGCRLLSYYYYPETGSCKDVISFNKLARMGNRDKMLLPIPQSYDFTRKFSGDSVAPWQIRNQFWMHMAYGAKGLIWFAYDGMTGSPGWEEIKKLSAVTDNLGPLILKLKYTHKNVALLGSYTDASYKWYLRHPRPDVEDIDFQLEQNHISSDIVAEEEILSGILKDYKVLVLYKMDFLPESVCEKIESYIRAGGMVLLSNGSAVSIPGAKVVAAEALPAEIKKLVQPDITIDSNDVVCNTFLYNGGRYLFVVNTNTKAETNATVSIAGTIPDKVYDLLSGQQVKLSGGRSFGINLEPGSGRLYGLYPYAVKSVCVASKTGNVAAGTDAVVHIKIEGGEKCALPIKVTVSDPSKVRPDYSDSYVVENGSLTVRIPVAINDPSGKWNITVKELSSGFIGQCAFSVLKKGL